MRKLATVIMALAALLVISSSAFGRETFEFKADLRGAQEVPSVTTRTKGEVTVRFNRQLTEAKFQIEVEDGVAITVAHFHCGVAGANGPVVVFMSGAIPGGFEVDGRLAKFTLTDANITAISPHPNCIASIGMDITSIATLAEAMRQGKIYANAHSVAHPAGEVRGQIEED